MVFYFTGTGNSYQAALAVKGETEALWEISSCLREGRALFRPAAGESVTFVCPVYYGGLPSVVLDFLRVLRLEGEPEYCCGVFTCGGGSYGAPGMLQGVLRSRGIRLDAAYTVVMPENYVLMFTLPPEEERDRLLGEAALRLEEIRGAILRRERRGLPVDLHKALLTRAMYPLYRRGRSTAKFYTDEQCIGCGTCVRRCPVEAMVMENGRPKWVKDTCVHCMACLRCGAVQYGNRTKGKKRYTNPLLKTCH